MTAAANRTLNREQLFGMMQAYKTTSLLRAGIDLGLFDVLARPSTAEAIAAACGADPRGARILLDALVAVGLVESDGATYRLVPGADELLVTDSPGYAGGMVRVFASDYEWDALKELSGAVRAGGTVQDVHAETPNYAFWEDFADHAPTVAEPTAEVLVAALEPWAATRREMRVLDVACGHGVYGTTVLKHHPTATMCALDWDNVLAVTARNVERAGLADRCGYLPGDMFSTPMGGPYDLVLITNVLHHFSEQRATELLVRARAALAPGGRLGLVGFVTTDALPSVDPAPFLFSVLMLAWTAAGEVHSLEAYDRMLSAAGFSPVGVHAVDRLPFRVLLAEPSS